MQRLAACEHDYLSNDSTIALNERRTLLVVILTATMMVGEILAGRLTGSMALLADGWHMASHAGALCIGLAAYRLAKSATLYRSFNFGAGKFIPLGGYTSAIILGMISLAMAWESATRLLSPSRIEFREAIAVAILGLAVNILSAIILGHGQEQGRTHGHDHSHSHGDDHGHKHEHAPPYHDHNLRSAYIHVLADAVTSVFAIAALGIGLLFGLTWLDPVMGIIGSLIIAVWAFRLLRETGWELLDGHAKAVDHALIHSLIEREGTRITDLHVWRVAPKAYACEVVILTDSPMGPDYYRDLIVAKVPVHHVVVEERCQK